MQVGTAEREPPEQQEQQHIGSSRKQRAPGPTGAEAAAVQEQEGAVQGSGPNAADSGAAKVEDGGQSSGAAAKEEGAAQAEQPGEEGAEGGASSQAKEQQQSGGASKPAKKMHWSTRARLEREAAATAAAAAGQAAPTDPLSTKAGAKSTSKAFSNKSQEQRGEGGAACCWSAVAGS